MVLLDDRSFKDHLATLCPPGIDFDQPLPPVPGDLRFGGLARRVIVVSPQALP